MPGRTPLARLGRVPPGVWTAVIWCAYMADSLHGDFQRRTGTRRRFRRQGALAPASRGGTGVTIRVLLADDQPLIRTALQMVITDTDDIEVAGRPGPAPRPSNWPGACAPTWW